nr:EOG090X08WB [Triops cancriformis]
MAVARDSDTSLWLHNKLGTSNDSWVSGSICSQLNSEVLKNIQECFVDLQTQVKLKLLLSFFQLSRRNLDEWRSELGDIIEVALVDGDPWVSMTAEVLKTYPGTGALNTELSQAVDEDNRRIVNDLLNDLRKLVKKQSESGMLPLECVYLNKTALYTVVGQQPQPPKHFTLKRKPKSAALRAELLQKSADAQSHIKKTPAPTIPMRSRGLPRKMTDTTPLKGIPSKLAMGSGMSRLGSVSGVPGVPAGLSTGPGALRTPSRPMAGRKDGGIKLLDITEQPVGFAQAKKRKRQQELEAAQKQSEQPVDEEKDLPTPDYAAGLAPPATPGPPAPQQSLDTPLTPSYVPKASSLNLAPPTPGGVVTTKEPTAPAAVTSRVVLMPTTTFKIGSTPSLTTPQTQPTMVRLVTSSSQPVTSTSTVIRLVQAVSSAPTPTATAGGAAATTTAPTAAPGVAAAPKKSVALMLTREQMQEAQEMFRNSNRVTRPEKALILGFMAGSRENPCPHLGKIVTIKLSEDEEIATQPDGTHVKMLVETHFQMNYAAGEWKRIKKHRKLEEIPVTQSTAESAV